MSKLKINKTFELIEKLQPMIRHQDLDTYEEEHGLGMFDVVFRQKDDSRTMWGGSTMTWEETDLRSLMNNIYDYLAEGYEMWIRETPELENDPSKISNEDMRYVISLQAYNFDDDMIALDCRIVSGWLVISLDFDATFDEERRFFVEFGYEEHYMLGPTLEDVTGYLMAFEIMDLTFDKIKKFRIKRANPNKTKCKHCQELNQSSLGLFREYDKHELDKKYDEIKKTESDHFLLHDMLPKGEYDETMSKIQEYKIQLEEEISKRNKSLKEFFERLKEQKYYVCNVCEGIFCNKMMLFNRVCLECRTDISNRIVEEKGYNHRWA